MGLMGIGLLLILAALGLTFVPYGEAGGSWMVIALGTLGALILCGGGELIQIYGARHNKKLSARAVGRVESISTGRGLLNDRLIVSLIVSFPASDGVVHRKQTRALVPLTSLASYEQGSSLFILYNPSDLDGGIRVESMH
jgi:hypothetical protein